MLPPLLLVPLISVALTLRQSPVYQATAQVFLSNGNLAASLAGVVDPNSSETPDRLATTQAQLARLPEVAQRAVAAAGAPDRDASELLSESSVTTDPNADLLYFTVHDRDAGIAQTLATTYARQFVAFRNQLDSAAVDRARTGIQRRLDELKAAGAEASTQYADLLAKRSQLSTLDVLQSTSTSVVRPADPAAQIGPRPPLRSVALGIGLGIALAIALAFLVEALDTRVRTVDEIEEWLRGIPPLGRLPAPTATRDDGDVEMLSDPGGPYAESIRMLRVRIGLASPRAGSSVIMVTSAGAQEGKSTTAANLAVALAQAGKSVILCDFDARRPTIAHLFQLPATPGLADVVLDHVDLQGALKAVLIPPKAYWRDGHSRDGQVGGMLEVLTLGRPPPDPGEFIGSEQVAHIVKRLRERADVVLIDTPAALAVGDPMLIAQVVDAVLLVVRLGAVRRSDLSELARAIGSSSAPVLGFVATGSKVGDRYDYGWYYERPALAGEEQEPLRK